MKEFFNILLSHPLGVALVLLPLSMLAKNFIGAGGSMLDETFNFDYLKRGLFKGLLLYIGIALIALITLIAPEINIDINGTNVSVMNAMVTLIMGSVLFYLYETFKLMAIVFKQKTTEEDLTNE